MELPRFVRIVNAKGSVVVEVLSKRLFLPVGFDYSRVLAWPIRLLVRLLFAILLVYACPYVADLHIAYMDEHELLMSMAANKQCWNDYLAFFSFGLEIVTAILIAGAAFSEWLTTSYKSTVDEWERKIEQARHNELTDVQQEAESLLKRHFDLIRSTTLTNLLSNLPKLYKTASGFSRLVYRDVGRVNFQFLLAKALVAFPGGLYGLLAFVLFYGLCLLKVLSYYVDHV
jgi:hypothetical protein